MLNYFFFRSTGVVTSKFNLKALNEKIGYGVETLSRGRYAEILSSSRSFTPDEEEYFAKAAQKAYASFTNKAALSRGMSLESLLEVAQGRVWTGRQAVSRGLVDHIGGVWAALNIGRCTFHNITQIYPFTPINLIVFCCFVYQRLI